jgi:hypothetical protein
MSLQDQAVSWDVRSLFYWTWPWIVALMIAVAAIGFTIYMKLQRSRRKFASSSSSEK